MRGTGLFLCIAATIPAAFGAWGMFSFEDGRRLSEMDGLICYFALWVAGLLVAIGVSFMLLARWRRRRFAAGFPVMVKKSVDRQEFAE